MSYETRFVGFIQSQKSITNVNCIKSKHGISVSLRQYWRKSWGVAWVGSSTCWAGFETCAIQRHQKSGGAATAFLHVCIDHYIFCIYYMALWNMFFLFGQLQHSVIWYFLIMTVIHSSAVYQNRSPD